MKENRRVLRRLRSEAAAALAGHHRQLGSLYASGRIQHPFAEAPPSPAGTDEAVS